jgi:hypothetical protein
VYFPAKRKRLKRRFASLVFRGSTFFEPHLSAYQRETTFVGLRRAVDRVFRRTEGWFYE